MRDGVPVVKCEPDLNENGTKLERLYKVYGSETLGSGGGQGVWLAKISSRVAIFTSDGRGGV